MSVPVPILLLQMMEVVRGMPEQRVSENSQCAALSRKATTHRHVHGHALSSKIQVSIESFVSIDSFSCRGYLTYSLV